MKRIVQVFVLALCASLLLSSCAVAPGAAGGAIELTDALGREVKLDKPPERIVALFPSDVEILYALGAGDNLIAVGEYCNYPPEALEKASLGSGANTSIEQIVALTPDLVTLGTMAQNAEDVASLEAAGITVVVTESSAASIEGAYASIDLLGKASGRQKEANEIIAGMKADFAAIAKQSEGLDKPTVYVEVSPLAFGLYTCGSGTFIDELVALAGGDNAFGDLEGWAQISQEQVISRAPDYILTTTSEEYGLGDPVQEIAGRPGWDALSAVEQGRVFTIDPDATTRPGPRLVQAAQQIFDILHGAR